MSDEQRLSFWFVGEAWPGLTVGELIDRLSTMPRDRPVLIAGDVRLMKGEANLALSVREADFPVSEFERGGGFRYHTVVEIEDVTTRIRERRAAEASRRPPTGSRRG